MELGETFGEFTVFGPIGLGSMSTVYAGFCPKLRELVALKVLRKEVDPGSQRRELFLKEGEVYHRLSHPNVVRFVASGEVKSQLYVAMELVRGKPLASLIHTEEGGVLTVDRAINVFLDLARAVEHTHERGIIHRDIKPSNVIVTQDDTVKLIDYGLAAPKEELNGPSDVIVGSPAYAAPEQNRGDGVNERADLYSLGCVFYEMLTGVRPISGDSLEEILALQSSRVPLLRAVKADAPAELEEIISKLLSPDPFSRYSNATEVIRELETIKSKAKKETQAYVIVFDKVAEAFEAAKLAYERGDLEGATCLATFYIGQRPLDAKGHFLMGKLMAEHEKYQEARDHFTKAIAMDKFNVDYRIDFALHFYRIGKFRHSLEQIDAAMGLRPDDWVIKGLEKLTFALLVIRK